LGGGVQVSFTREGRAKEGKKEEKVLKTLIRAKRFPQRERKKKRDIAGVKGEQERESWRQIPSRTLERAR